MWGIRLSKSYGKTGLVVHDRDGYQVWSTHHMPWGELAKFVDGMAHQAALRGMKKQGEL